MKKRSIFISILIIIFLSSNIAFAEAGVTEVSSELKKVGTVDHIYNFAGDLARYEVDGKWGYMDKKGNIIIEPKFDFAFDFRLGLARVIVDNKYGFIDKKGEYFVKPKIDADKYYVADFYNGFAKIYKGINVAFINEKGDIICDFEYNNSNDTHALNENLILVIKRKSWRAESKGIYDNQIRYEHEDKFGLIDSKGKTVVEPIYDRIDVYRIVDRENRITHVYENLVKVSLDDKYGFYDSNGNVLLECKYDWSSPVFQKKLEELKSKNKPKTIDWWGKNNQASNSQVLNQERKTIPVVDVKRNEDGTARFIDKNGNYASNEVFANIKLFENPYGDYFYLCSVEENNKEYFMFYDLDGKRLFDRKYGYYSCELHYQSSELYYTAAIARTASGELDLIDLKGDINIIKSVKEKTYNLVKTDEYIRYSVVEDPTKKSLVNVLMDYEGNEIARFRNNYEHYYSWNGLINYIDSGLLGERPTWSNGIGSLQNYTYSKHKKGDTLQKDYEELNKTHRIGIWSTGYGIADDGELQYGGGSWRKIGNSTVEITSWENKPVVSIAMWALSDGLEGYARDNMLVQNTTMEALKYYSKNDEDAEELWEYIDDHIKQGIYPVGKAQSKVVEFGDLKVKIERGEYADHILDIIFLN